MKKKYIPTKLHREIINRDKCTCQYCGKISVYTNHYGPRAIEITKERSYSQNYDYPYYKEIAFEFDHIIPESLGGKIELNNLVLPCQSYNRNKGKKTISNPNSKLPT